MASPSSPSPDAVQPEPSPFTPAMFPREFYNPIVASKDPQAAYDHILTSRRLKTPAHTRPTSPPRAPLKEDEMAFDHLHDCAICGRRHAGPCNPYRGVNAPHWQRLMPAWGMTQAQCEHFWRERVVPGLKGKQLVAPEDFAAGYDALADEWARQIAGDIHHWETERRAAAGSGFEGPSVETVRQELGGRVADAVREARERPASEVFDGRAVSMEEDWASFGHRIGASIAEALDDLLKKYVPDGGPDAGRFPSEEDMVAEWGALVKDCRLL